MMYNLLSVMVFNDNDKYCVSDETMKIYEKGLNCRLIKVKASGSSEYY